ncbi:hypothetical protein [Nocardiopsis baichengensis]|uniref:hypothetical protein n=1 Tax=Nocardiopsis baichengensis TaxID=280240 RepID=UPI0003480BC3|nr:hypothetical protein [Nocardiopsis baichengensis]
MAKPRSTEELARRLHAAVRALEPDLSLPEPAEGDPQPTAELLGVLAAVTDDIIRAQDHEHRPRTVAAYNSVLGNNDDETDMALMYQRFAERIRFTGLAMTPVGGQGVVTLANGCLVAAYEGALLGAEAGEHFADLDRDKPLPIEVREKMNERLIRAQQYMETARQGVAMLAGYPDGAPGEDQGQVLESADERITRITDMGASVIVDYAFPTPDGPVRSRGQAFLNDIPELVGLTAEERAETIVEMIEADVDRVQAQILQPPQQDD